MSYWNIRQDFLSLFNRNDAPQNHFYPIDGLRSIASLLIITCHVIPFFAAFIKPYPHVEWQEFLQSQAFIIIPFLGLALEIFFLISGFLLTHKLVESWMRNDHNRELFLQQYPLFILKRALRFWPGILLAMIIMFILGEPRDINAGVLPYISIWLFFQNYIGIDNFVASLSPLWSISMDVQVYILLPLVLYIFYSSRKYIPVYYSLAVLLLLSIVRSIILFDPVTMPVMTAPLQYNMLTLVIQKRVCPWFQSHYNLTFPFECLQTNPIKSFVEILYLPLQARFGSFIIGAMLAIKLLQATSQNNQSNTLKKFIFLGLIFLYLLLTATHHPDSKPISNLTLTILIATSRQIFTFGQAFILFTALCPTSHPYHAPWIKRFLSSPIWIPISKLSYLVYLIHWRLIFEIIFGGPLLFLKEYSVTYATIISVPIILIVSQIISCVWFLLVEKPFERIVHQYFNGHKSSRIHSE